MNPIEIRLDPAAVAPLLAVVGPALQRLEGELATDAEHPGDDPDIEAFWRRDLLESQREEVAVVASIFDDNFRKTGRAYVAPEVMERLLRACSAIRLKLRETALAPMQDSQLENGDFESVDWTEELRMGYAAYTLFANLQELVVSQMDGDRGESGYEEDWEGDDFEDDEPSA